MNYKIKKLIVIIKRNKLKIGIMLLIPFLLTISFVKIMDRTVKKRSMPVQYLVVHWTANTASGADARANAYYLRNKKAAGTHYCIDDEEIVLCTDEDNVAYAVGGPLWRGFRPKFWLHGKILNNNSISFEMCLGGGRNDSIIIDQTAQLVGKRLVTYGLDMSRVVRHYDVNGKPCPRFCYNDPEWNLIREDSSFSEFKKIVEKYYNFHLYRKKIWKETNEWIDTIPDNVGKSTLNFQMQ